MRESCTTTQTQPDTSGAGSVRPLRIAVTGATGTIGCRVVRHLAPRHHVQVITRNPEAAQRKGIPGCKVRADFADRRAMRRAVAGVDALMLITCDPLSPDHDEVVLEAARASGVRHVVKLSALAVTDPDAQDLITRWQRACEDMVRASGMEWTLLRSRAFMSKALDWAPSIRAQGVVRAVYGSSPNSCVDPSDVAEVAAHTLTEPGHFGRSYALTGPVALTAREQADILAGELGRPLRFEELTVEQAREGWRRRYPEAFAGAVAESAERQRAGAKASVADGVRSVTGRAPTSFADWVRQQAHRFR